MPPPHPPGENLLNLTRRENNLQTMVTFSPDPHQALQSSSRHALAPSAEPPGMTLLCTDFPEETGSSMGCTTWNLQRGWNSLPRIPQHQRSHFSGLALECRVPPPEAVGHLEWQALRSGDSSLVSLVSPHPLLLSRISSGSSLQFISGGFKRHRDMDAPALLTPEKSSVDPGEGLGAKGEL